MGPQITVLDVTRRTESDGQPEGIVTTINADLLRCIQDGIVCDCIDAALLQSLVKSRSILCLKCSDKALNKGPFL